MTVAAPAPLPPRRGGPTRAEIGAWLRRLAVASNTTRVAIRGLATLLACTACVAVVPDAKAWAYAHEPLALAHVLDAWLELARKAALVALVPAGLAAANGHAPWLAPKPLAPDEPAVVAAGVAPPQ